MQKKCYAALLFCVLLMTAILGGCQAGSEPVAGKPQQAEGPVAKQGSAEQKEFAAGYALFSKTCRVCHGNEGNGRGSRKGPSLQRSEYTYGRSREAVQEVMKLVIVAVMLGFGVALALIIGQRMSTDAMAVVIGVAVGVASSVPTSILLMALLRRERAGMTNWQQEAPQQQLQQPNFIVLNPSDLVSGRHQQPHVPMPPPEYGIDGGMRRLRVVGDEEEWS